MSLPGALLHDAIDDAPPPRSFVQTAFGRLAYRRGGSGPPLILIHGSLVTADDMAIALMARLSRRFDVVAFDRPGHGGSEQTPSDPGSPYAQAAALAAGWTALGLERPAIVGHSFGGAVALALALTVPDAITRVVALAPYCFPEPRLEQVLFGPRALPIVGTAFARSLGVADLATLPLLRNLMFSPRTMPTAYADAYPFAWASTPSMLTANGEDSLRVLPDLTRSARNYAQCQVPVRILGGTNDIVVSNAIQGLAAAQLMPRATFDWVRGEGHMLHHFQQDLVEAALSEQD